MKRENYKRYGFGRPKKIVDPKWVKDLPKDDDQWTMEQEEAYLKYCAVYGRRGYSEEEWDKIHEERRRQKRESFADLADSLSDYNSVDILRVLQKQLEWQAEYFENFSHIENGLYYASKMRLCCRLIDIVCWGGMTGEYKLRLGKYVNLRNAARFESVPDWNLSYLGGKKQEIRYKKAYCLLFKILFNNVMRWWD